jgi:voltage-gated potassium channel
MHVERLLGNRRIAAVAIVWLGILVLTSFGLYVAEHGTNEAVATPLDALWWGVVTMTTVGYGDVYPMTGEGRVAAAILMVLGIGLFGVITATVTSLLVRDEEGSLVEADDPITKLDRLFVLASAGAVTEDEYVAKKRELLERM